MEKNCRPKSSSKRVVIDLMDSSSSSNSDSDDVEVVVVSSNNKKRPAAVRKKPSSSVTTANGIKKTRQDTKSLEIKQSNDNNTKKFSVASYNIWFNMEANPDERMMALSKALLEQNTNERPLWFVGFQEVTAALWAMLCPVLESAGYRTFCQEEAIFGGHYGVAIAVLTTPDVGVRILQHGFESFPRSMSCQGRGFLHVRARLPHSNQQVVFTTTHLESFMPPGQAGPETYTGSAQRQQQVKLIETFCNNHMKRFPDVCTAMISGDLNWDDERVQSTGADQPLLSIISTGGWTDTWFSIRDQRRRAFMDKNGKIKKKDEPNCFTYDGKENPMLSGSLRRRFDRILFRTQNDTTTTTTTTTTTKTNNNNCRQCYSNRSRSNRYHYMDKAECLEW